MSCETVIGSIVALLDGELAEAERLEVEEHLATCPGCALELQELRATRRIVTAHLGAARAHAGSPRFEAVWERISAEPAEGSPGSAAKRPGAGARSGSVVRAPSRRRRWLWAGTSAGVALAAGIAALVLVPRPSGVAPVSGKAGRAGAPAVASLPASQGASSKPAKEPTRLAKEKKRDDGAAQEQVARRSVPEAAPDAAPVEPPVEEALAVNELDPPRELLERPDLFLNYPIVRKLDELRNLDAVLAGPGPDEQADDGGAG